MRELFKKYTDSEILKYYSSATVEGRRKARVIHLSLRKVNEIYKGNMQAEAEEVKELYLMIRYLLPEEIWQEICACYEKENVSMDLILEMGDSQGNDLIRGILMLLKMCEGMNVGV